MSDEVMCYKSFILGQSALVNHDEIIRTYERAPNAKLAMYGRHLRQIYSDVVYSKRIMAYISDVEQSTLINDYLGLLPYFLFSPERAIVEDGLKNLHWVGVAHPCIEIREHVSELMDRSELHLNNLV